MLGYRLTLGEGGPLLIMYWDSHELLYAYASRPDAQHRPAWTRFNQRARKAPGAVGIWHETFQVAVAESIYAGHAGQRAGQGDGRRAGGSSG